MDALNRDSKFWGLFVGDMFDYGSVRYIWGEGTGINDNGLVTFDRLGRKDAFYLYKANWNKSDPFVHIVGKRLDTLQSATQTIKVYSHLQSVQLSLNGNPLGSGKCKDGVFVWANVKLAPWQNLLLATGALAFQDRAVLRVTPSVGLSRY